MRRIFRLLFLALVLVLVALLSMLTAMRMAIHRSEVAVPRLVGLAPAQAERLANDNGLLLQVENRFYSSEVAEGKVASQLPLPGVRVRRGWRVRVAQSLGPQRTTIPNLVGQSRRAAEMNIARRALEVGSVARVRLPDVPPEQVVAQSPAPNSPDVTSPKIYLLVNASDTAKEMIMPDFVGRHLAEASDAIDEAGLKLITDAQQSASGGPSAVLRQSPAPGQRVTAGATVRLEIAK